MKRQTHAVIDRKSWLEMRKRNISASDASVLFHANPYKTMLSLWAEKTGRVQPEDIDNAVLRRGRILEPAVAAGLREEYPEWIINSAGNYVEMTDVRLGATPDFLGWPNRKQYDDANCFLIQAKTVLESVFLEEWTPAPPAHYLIQVQTEMLVTGCNRSLLAPMILDNRAFPIREYWFDADPAFHEQILSRAAAFWKCVDEDREPPMKPEQDGATFAALYPQGEPDPVLALHGDAAFVSACADYKDASAQIKALETRKAAAACKVMERLRNHAKAEAQDWRVNWGNVPEASVAAFVKKAHRRLTISKIKGA